MKMEYLSLMRIFRSRAMRFPLFLTWKCGRFCHAFGTPIGRSLSPIVHELTFFVGRLTVPFSRHDEYTRANFMRFDLWYLLEQAGFKSFKLYADLRTRANSSTFVGFLSHRSRRTSWPSQAIALILFIMGIKYLLDQAEGLKIVAMSGNFMQRRACYRTWHGLDAGKWRSGSGPPFSQVFRRWFLGQGAVDILARLSAILQLGQRKFWFIKDIRFYKYTEQQ